MSTIFRGRAREGRWAKAPLFGRPQNAPSPVVGGSPPARCALDDDAMAKVRVRAAHLREPEEERDELLLFVLRHDRRSLTPPVPVSTVRDPPTLWGARETHGLLNM